MQRTDPRTSGGLHVNSLQQVLSTGEGSGCMGSLLNAHDVSLRHQIGKPIRIQKTHCTPLGACGMQVERCESILTYAISFVTYCTWWTHDNYITNCNIRYTLLLATEGLGGEFGFIRKLETFYTQTFTHSVFYFDFKQVINRKYILSIKIINS